MLQDFMSKALNAKVCVMTIPLLSLDAGLDLNFR